jgi:hypothetical protein
LALGRRLHDTASIRRWQRWDRARRLEVASRPGGDDRITVVVPLYDEVAIVGPTVDFWVGMAGEVDGLDVLLVTTDKEGDGPGTTFAAVQQALADRSAAGVELLHCPVVHRYRAAQIDLATATVAERAGPDPRCHWLSLYNADSRPERSTFHELRVRAADDPSIRAHQQLAEYAVPADRPASRWMAAFAASQSWWIHARWFRETHRTLATGRQDRSPLTTFGHGEHLRLDLALEIGTFPAYAYADGLLLGWELRATAEPLGVLAAHDWAEVPRTVPDLVTQHRAWFRGMLTLPRALDDHPERRPPRLSAAGRRRLRLAHAARTLLWGGRPVVAVLAVALVARAWRQDRRVAVAALLGLAANPLVPPLLARAWWAPARRTRTADLLGASLLVPFVDGAGFWWALLDARADPTAPPPKTPR